MAGTDVAAAARADHVGMDFTTISALTQDRQRDIRRDADLVHRARFARRRRTTPRPADRSPADAR